MWFVEGDRNIKYFHRIAKIKNRTRGIHLMKIEGNFSTDPDMIATHVVNHYT